MRIRNDYPLEDEFFYEDYSELVFYHGTSSALHITQLLPSDETGNLREEWRRKLTNKVFFTTSQHSADKYAKKACEKYGGRPVVFIVRPIGEIWHIHTNEYASDSAEIVCPVNK